MTDRDLFYCIHQSMLIDHLAADVADGHTCRRRTGVKGRVLTASQSPSAAHVAQHQTGCLQTDADIVIFG